jgi:hypothetical protein
MAREARRREGAHERGGALLAAIIMITLLGALVAGYSMNVASAIRLRGGTAQQQIGYYAAEAGLNVGIGRFANIFKKHGVPKDADFEQSMQVGARDVDVTLAEVADCAPCEPTQIPQGELFAGLKTIPYRYVVQSRSFARAGDTEAHLAGEFDIHNIPLFQFLAFVDGHLFIMPVTLTALHGRLHTNANLYVQPDRTLTIEDLPPSIPNVQVTAGGDIYRGGRKYDDTWRCSGRAIIDKLEDLVAPPNDLDPKEVFCMGQSPLPDNVLAGWKGSIKSDVGDINIPDVSIINRGSGEYWEHADLRIVLRLDMPRAAIDFGAPDLCPGGPGTLVSPALFPIEVQGPDGAAKTRALWRFMCERRGALFYTDVPNNVPTPPSNVTWVPLQDPNNYTPPFNNGAPPNPNPRVYRRAGEDTSGDGRLTLLDGNNAICPVGPLAGEAAPWWTPPSCPWPNLVPAADSWFQDMDYRRGGFFNHREQQWMVLLNLNVRALIEWNAVNGDPLFPRDDETDGGLIVFLSVQGPDSGAANNYGVRILDSADLDMRNATFRPGGADPIGLTVVSDQAIIAEGNYNRRDKVPASIVGDAVWILSQGWETPVAGAQNDLKSAFALSTLPFRRAVPSSDFPGGPAGAGSFSGTQSLGMNAALLFGLGPSTRNPDWYNGGVENFPRFLEDWRSRTFNYRGSFVSLGEPQHKKNNWACGEGYDCNGTGVYFAPNRQYDYDADFNRVELLPPLTPTFVYVQQRLYTRIFD